MRSHRTLSTSALLFTALLVWAVLGTLLVGGQLRLLYSSVANMTTFNLLAECAAVAASVVLFAAALTIAIPATLKPGSWLRKIILVLPILFLVFTLVGVISDLLGVGITENLGQIGPVTINFASAWLIIGGVLSTIAVVVAAAWMQLSPRLMQAETVTMSIAGAFGLIATVGLVLTVILVSTNQPSFSNFGGRPGDGAGRPNFPAPGGQGGTNPGGAVVTPEVSGAAGGQSRTGLAPQATAEIPSGQGSATQGGQGSTALTPQATAEVFGARQAAPSATTGGRNRDTGQTGSDRQGPPGGFGGPGGGITQSIDRYKVGGLIAGVVAVIDLILIAAVWRTARWIAGNAIATATSTAYGREAGRALVSALGVTLFLLIAIQLVPVARANPAVKTNIQWDSAQTQQLWTSACADCHSSETRWPWYAYVAPASWLTVLHVNAARQEYNLSNYDSLPAFRRQMLAEQMAEQIRSGTMPPADYQLLHPDARLTDAEKQQLIDGLQKSLAATS